MEDVSIAYVPLDSRPVNYNYPVKLAEIAGFELWTPPREFLGDLNKCGNAQKICNFLKEITPKIQALIVSIDIIAYGGLIFSRKLNTTFQGAYQRIQVLKEVKKINPGITIYSFNVLLRISTSVKDEESYNLWKMIFRYSILVDKLQKESKKEDELELKELERKIPQYPLEEYLTVRRRNHNINIKVLQLAEEGIIDFLIFSQEDAAEFGLHKREQEILLKIVKEKKLQDKVSLQTGCDEIGMQLICKYFNNFRKSYPKIFIFPKISALKTIPLYEDTIISKNLREKVKSVNVRIENSFKNSDFIFAVHSDKYGQKDIFLDGVSYKKEKLNNFIKKIKNYSEKKYRLATADVFYCNGADEEFIKMLTEEIKISNLLSYAGWNTAGNSIGCALSEACVSFKIDNKTKLRKNLEFLFIRFLEDFGYSVKIRPIMNNYLQKIGLSPYNIKKNFKEIENLMQKQMKNFAEKFFERNFKDKIIEIEGEKFKINKLKKIHFYFPWGRTFEIGTDVYIEIK